MKMKTWNVLADHSWDERPRGRLRREWEFNVKPAFIKPVAEQLHPRQCHRLPICFSTSDLTNQKQEQKNSDCETSWLVYSTLFYVKHTVQDRWGDFWIGGDIVTNISPRNFIVTFIAWSLNLYVGQKCRHLFQRRMWWGGWNVQWSTNLSWTSWTSICFHYDNNVVDDGNGWVCHQ